MRSLIFDQLSVRSSSQRLANQFVFSKTLNLITAKDNSVGKTTLVKLLYWTFGCEVFFDTTWESIDCESFVKFHIGADNFLVSRYKDQIFFRDCNGESKVYNKITGEYSEQLASILGFNLLLPNRVSGELEAPPPAFYFLPYYIDQKRSWAKALDNFDKLSQYANWQENTLKYHVGLIGEDYFEIEHAILAENEKKGEHNVKITNYEAAVQVVESIVPRNETVIDEKMLTIAVDSLKHKMQTLTSEQESLFVKIAEYTDELTFLEQQKTLSLALVEEISKDYSFSVENVSNDWIECPLCGVIHNNSITSRASILADKNQSQQQIRTIETKISKVTTKLDGLKDRQDILKEEISDLNKQFRLNGGGEDFVGYISGIASNAIQSKVQEKISVEVVEVNSIEKEIKAKKNEQKALMAPKDRKSIYSNFLKYLVRYLEKLDAKNINLSKVKTPMDYSAIQKEGGAAEGSRAMFAYYLAIYSTIKDKPNSSIAPITVDTPNQHEQSHINYSKIVDLIINSISSDDTQLFLCAMENSDIDLIVKKSIVFRLDNNKILVKSMFDVVESEFINERIFYYPQTEK